MGFFNKLWNWVKGKGFTEETTTQTTTPTTIVEPTIRETTQRIDKEIETTKKQEEAKQKEETPTKGRKTIIKELDQQIRETKTTQQKEYEKAITRMDKLKDLKNITKGIKDQGLTKTMLQTQDMDLGQTRKNYTDLFAEGAKITDPQILDILIENREKLRQRFSAEIKVWLDGEQAGTLYVHGILVEELSIIQQELQEGMLLRKDIKEEYLSNKLDNLQNEFRAYGARDTHYNVIKEKETITNITYEMTFA